MSRNQRRGGIGLFLLASQIMQIGTDRISPVTLFTVALNAVIYMRFLPSLPSVNSACSSNLAVFGRKEWKRLIFSSFYHLDDMHLYFNMVSFIWKGITLERKLGKRKFIILLAVFSIATQIVMLGLNKVFATVFLNDYYLRTCAAGFSAVIFALKVLTTSSSNGSERVLGLPLTVPTKYACWVELVVIQLLVPNASFTGHLAGILVGLMYIYGPLKWLVKAFSKLSKESGGGTWPVLLGSHGKIFQLRNAPPFTNHQGSTGYRSSGTQPRRQTYPNQPQNLDEEDEQLQRAMRESLRDHHQQQQSSQPPTYGWSVPSNSSGSQPSPYPPAENINSRRNNLYPDLNDRTYKTPSAPPEPSSEPPTGGLPYPPADEWGGHNNPPYPTDDTILPRRPLHTNYDEDDLRRARLRRFDKT